MRVLQRIKSIQFILTFWYSLLLLVAFALFGWGVYIYLEHLLGAKLDQNLSEEVDWIAQIVDIERTRLNGRTPLDSLSEDIENRIADHFASTQRNYIVMLTSTQGSILYESDDRGEAILSSIELQTTALVVKTVHIPSQGMLRVAGRRVDPFVIQVGYTEESTQSVLTNLLTIFGVLVPVVLFVAFSGGWLMAGLILRPIKEISATANRITARNLNERIPERKVDDELGTLITTMNGMIARLQSSFEEMRQFSMNVAHELKTPLTIMKGESELALSKPLSSEEMQELVTTYLEETVRMSRIIDDLLTLAKADAGQITVQREPVKLEAIIRDLYEDALVLAVPGGLSVELVKAEPCVVAGDPARLRQLFRIMLTNAVQYNDAGGKIRMGCERTDGKALVSIEDTGIGIPPESLDKIFQRFYRVDQARTRVKGGSGLGLSLAKWIVESHGGRISVSSTPGKGSIFTVELPLSSAGS